MPADDLRDLAAENAQLRARAEHAEGELSARDAHTTRWETEKARADKAEAAIERVRFHCADVEEWASACMLDTPPWIAGVRAALDAPQRHEGAPTAVSAEDVAN